MASQATRSAIRAAVPGAATEILASLPFVTAFAGTGAASKTFLQAVHGFEAPSYVQVTMKKSTAPTQVQVTYDISGTTVTVYFWKATSAVDTTLIADTGDFAGSIAIWGTP